MVVFLRKGHLKIVNFSVLPQQKLLFRVPETSLQNFLSFSCFLQAQSALSLLRTLPVRVLRHTAACKYFQSFVKVLFAVFVCAQLPWNWLFKPIPLSSPKPVLQPKAKTWQWAFFPSASQNPIIYVQTYHHERVRIPS